MKPIVTLTLNPTIDGASEADVVRPIHKVRTRNERFDPGGGGINVSRVVRELGGETLAIYLAGGATGPVLDALLERRAVPRTVVPIKGHTRISQTVFETSSGLEFRFVPEGPRIAPDEAQRCLETLARSDCDWLVASGSLPRGLDAGFYATVGAQARAKGARFVLDTSGDALRETLAGGGVFLCKPSQGEFESLVGRKLEPGELEREAAALVASGKVTLLAITLGHEGAVLVDGDGAFRLPALPVEARSAVGAGDSFVAAMTLGLATGRSAREAFVMGLAAGTAAVLTPGSDLCRREDFERLHVQATRAAAEASGGA
jgi:6-phosphofructokinase 2